MEINIPNDVLNVVIGEAYEGPYTLGDELKQLQDPIEYVEYELCGPPGDENGYFKHFIVYTKSEVGVLVSTLLGGENLVILRRHPPSTPEGNGNITILKRIE